MWSDNRTNSVDRMFVGHLNICEHVISIYKFIFERELHSANTSVVGYAFSVFTASAPRYQHSAPRLQPAEESI